MYLESAVNKKCLMEEAIPSSLCVQEILLIYREKEITVWVPGSRATIGCLRNGPLSAGAKTWIKTSTAGGETRPGSFWNT